MICIGSSDCLDESVAARRAGSGLGVSVPGDEIGQQPQTGALALFRVELHGEDISPRYRASKRHRIRRRTDGKPGLVGHGEVAVREIEALAVVNARPERMRSRPMHWAPSHVWNLQPLARRKYHVLVAEPAHVAAERTKAGRRALVARVEQHLQPEADAEERPVGEARLDDAATSRGCEMG